MARFRLLCIVLSVLVGALVPLLDSRNGLAPLVYTTRDIPSGEKLTTEDLIVKWVPPEKVPPGTLKRVSEGTGRTVTYGITSGQIVSWWDFSRPDSTRVYVSSNRIPKGQVITDLSQLKEKYLSDPDVDRRIVHDLNDIVRKKASMDIAADRMLYKKYFE